MRVFRRRRAERLEQFEVFGRVHDVVLTADDMADSHFDVIDHIREMEDVASIGAPEGHVRFLTSVEGDVAADAVVHGDRTARRLEPDRAAGLVIHVSGDLEFLEVPVIDRLALALKIRPRRTTDPRALVPFEPEPAKPVEYGGQRLRSISRGVGVLDAEDEGPVVFAREQPVEQRGPRATDVKIAGGRWRESHANVGSHGIGDHQTTA